MTNKFLLEAGASLAVTGFPIARGKLADTYGFSAKPTDVSITDAATGFQYNARTSYFERNAQNRYVERFSASYVTGSHAFKAGFEAQQGLTDVMTVVNSDQNWTFNRGVPSQIVQWATPYQQRPRFKELGVYAQDRWTIKRLTINYGLRFDRFRAYTLAEDGSLPTDFTGNPVAPALFIAPRAFPAVDNVPLFTDLSPRLGAAYDLFGTARTALKASVGRYVNKGSNQIALANHPVTTSINSVSRVWTDANGNYSPDCDLRDFAANGECQAISNVNFGRANSGALQYADDLIHGFGKRDYFWDVSTELQQELGPRVSVTAGYYRNWSDHFGSQTLGWPTGHNNNLAVTPADFSPYCITAPVDPQLPGGGGYQVCGLYDVAPAKFGQGQIVAERASNHGGKSRASDFVTVSVNTRLGGGRDLGGSIDTGRTVDDLCFVIDSPQELLNCRVVTPFNAQTQVKMYGSYPLPAGFVVSGVLQNVSGSEYAANWAVPNALIAPSLGRSLAACGTRPVCTATAVVPLVVPQTLFNPRRTVLDVRGSRIFLVGKRKTRLRANFDVFNALNRSDIVTPVSTYGPQWQLPGASVTNVLTMLGGRTIQFSGALNF